MREESLPLRRPSIAPRRWRLWLVAGATASVATFSGAAGAAESNSGGCAGGWFALQARVISIAPPTARVFKGRAGSLASVPVMQDSFLCAGEMLVFDAASEPVSVELLEAGKVTRVDSSKRSYTVRSGVDAGAGTAGAFIDALLSGARLLGPRTARGQVNGVRGGSGAPVNLSTVSQVSAVLPLAELPRQKLAVDSSANVSWLNGAGPFKCETRDDDNTLLWASAPTQLQWCAVPMQSRKIASVVVREASGRSMRWQVEVVDTAEIPKPPSAVSTSRNRSANDTTAWAIWLWQKGGPQWRLQALGLAASVENDVFLARHFLDSVLAGIPLVTPDN
jgi:hypothetical protein